MLKIRKKLGKVKRAVRKYCLCIYKIYRIPQRSILRHKIKTQGANIGPMNGPKDKHPVSIIATCFYLGKALPASARCEYQPSHYIGEDTFEGNIDTVRTLLGDRMPEIEEEELQSFFGRFDRKYQNHKALQYTSTDLIVYFCDWLLYAKERGFTHNCYFDYELYNKEPDVRDTFLNEGYRSRVYAACNNKRDGRKYLDKALFNKTFRAHVKRDWILASKVSYDEFLMFIEKHEKFFAKPVRGTGGQGARVIDRSSDTYENLYTCCKEENLILEEVIKQHPALAEFNSSTVNTVRVNTLWCADDVVRVVLTVARFGRAGNAVDNFHGGGVGAIVDIDTGIIITEAQNRVHQTTAVHPDSGKSIIGFQYPKWEEIKEAVCKAARKTPNIRHVGWDVTVTADGKIEFVEGNSRPNFDVLQSPDQLGRRFRYTPYIPKIEKMKGIEYPELPPLEIDITGMETA